MGTGSRSTTHRRRAGLFAVAGLSLAGCAMEVPEIGTDVEDITASEIVESSAADTGDPGAVARERACNQDFSGEATPYTGQQVRLSAEVSETLSPVPSRLPVRWNCGWS